MRKIIFILGLFLLFTNCEKQSIFTDLVGAPNAFVLNSRYISHTPDSISMEMEVGIITSRSRDITIIDDTSFKDPNNHDYFDFNVDTVYQFKKNENLPFSTIFLIDLSGSYISYDPFNQRLRALRKFFNEVEYNINSYAGFARYSRNGYYKSYASIYLYDRNPFLLNWEDVVENEFYLTYFGGGTASMNDAIYWITNKWLVDSIPYENKSITVLAHDVDDGYGKEYQEVIDSAIIKGVKINIISLGAISQDFYEISQRTGGFINIISNTDVGGVMDKGTPMIGELHRILSNNLNVYKIKFRIVRRRGNYFSSGVRVWHYILIDQKDEYGNDFIYNLLPFYVKLP